jgi:hypothetical protein
VRYSPRPTIAFDKMPETLRVTQHIAVSDFSQHLSDEHFLNNAFFRATRRNHRLSYVTRQVLQNIQVICTVGF